MIASRMAVATQNVTHSASDRAVTGSSPVEALTEGEEGFKRLIRLEYALRLPQWRRAAPTPAYYLTTLARDRFG